MKIIINADDLGYSAHRDAGIFEAFSKGVITQASLIVNGAHSIDASKHAKKIGLPMGLHLNLTEGVPLTTTNMLTGPNGFMHYKTKFWDFKKDELFMKEIYDETLAQLEQFKVLTGQYPTHVDGHQHVHVASGIPDLLAPLFAAKGIVSIRIPDQDTDSLDWIDSKTRHRYENRYVPSVKARLIYKHHNITSSDCFIGLGMVGKQMSIARIQKSLEKCFGTVEFMVHPGFIEPLGPHNDGMDDLFDTDMGRLHEIRTLVDVTTFPTLTSWPTCSDQ